MLKTRQMLEWEYRPHLGRTTDQAIGASQDRLELMRKLQSDFEIALPLHELQSFAKAEGYYSGLPRDIRLAQLDHIKSLYQQLYPTLRLHLFDARRVFSAPVTVFGPLLAVLYIGQNYIAFRDKDRIQTISRPFDGLVREVAISDREIIGHLDALTLAAQKARDPA